MNMFMIFMSAMQLNSKQILTHASDSVSGDEVRIIKSVFERICDDGGYSPRALLSWLDQSGRLSKGRDNLYKSAKVNGKAVRCACINMAENSPNEFVSVEDGELPFN